MSVCAVVVVVFPQLIHSWFIVFRYVKTGGNAHFVSWWTCR